MCYTGRIKCNRQYSRVNLGPAAGRVAIVYKRYVYSFSQAVHLLSISLLYLCPLITTLLILYEKALTLKHVVWPLLRSTGFGV
jgi:hypothetical protein